MGKKCIRIKHANSGTLIAEGPISWGITPFEGNYYIASKFLRTTGFRVNYIPGLCIYKFLYVWLDFVPIRSSPESTAGNKKSDDATIKNLGWKYWLPNPLLPFIWFRVAVPQHHPQLLVEEYDCGP